MICDDRILQTDVVNRETMYSHFAYYTTKTLKLIIVPGVPWEICALKSIVTVLMSDEFTISAY